MREEAGKESPLQRTTFFQILRVLGAHTKVEQGVDSARVEFRKAMADLLSVLTRICNGAPLALRRVRSPTSCDSFPRLQLRIAMTFSAASCATWTRCLRSWRMNTCGRCHCWAALITYA
jgi:hypothetical protein